MKLYVADHRGESSSEEEALLTSLFTFALDYLGEKAETELSLTFVDGEEMAQMNGTYRNLPEETDVLSFPLFEEYAGVRQLGDIVINVDRCKSQAEVFGHSYYRELTYLSIHSLLHLYGYDHMEEEERRKMRKKEEEILRAYEKESRE